MFHNNNILFADDISVLIEGNDIESTIKIIYSELAKISTWPTQNKLKMLLAEKDGRIW